MASELLTAETSDPYRAKIASSVHQQGFSTRMVKMDHWSENKG